MNIYRPDDPFADMEAAQVLKERIWQPIGHDAEKHSVAWANFKAAEIAVREVRGKAIHSLEHRLSLQQWERGERASPWPDPTPAEIERADNAVRELIAPLLSDDELRLVSKQARAFNRSMK